MKKTTMAVMLCIGLLLSSCGKEYAVTNREAARMDPYIFDKTEPTDVTEKRIEAHTYEGDEPHTEVYTLKTYKNTADFEDLYGAREFRTAEFDVPEDCDFFYALLAHRQYLYFLVEEGTEHRVFRYNMDDGTSEDVFTHVGEKPITLCALNDDYLVWAEDDSDNWYDITLNCYDMANKTNGVIRSDTGEVNVSMNAVLDGDDVYFTVRPNAAEAEGSLYRYNAKSGKTERIETKNALKPLNYKGISWLSYDKDSGEYMVENESGAMVNLGEKEAAVYSSENLLVGFKTSGNSGIMYYDGNDSIPIIETTGNLDGVCCTDAFIMWNGWSNDYPMYYDVAKDTIVYVNTIDGDRKYKPYLTDDYLVLEANVFIPDEERGEDAVRVKTLLFRYIPTDELK